MQLKFAGDKEAVLDIVQKAHIANDNKQKKGLAKVDYGLREIANHSATKVRANFNKLLRHIQRFNIKMEQRGALMKILEIPFTSRHEKVMQEARVYIKKVTEFVKQQQQQKESQDHRNKVVYVSEQTLKALNDAKRNLVKLRKRTSKTSDNISEVWYQMMVDYWESRYYIEQTHGLREAAKKKLDEEVRLREEAEEKAKREEYERREKLRRQHVTDYLKEEDEEQSNSLNTSYEQDDGEGANMNIEEEKPGEGESEGHEGGDESSEVSSDSSDSEGQHSKANQEEEEKEKAPPKSKKLLKLEKRAAFNETESRIKILTRWKAKLKELLREARILTAKEAQHAVVNLQVPEKVDSNRNIGSSFSSKPVESRQPSVQTHHGNVKFTTVDDHNGSQERPDGRTYETAVETKRRIKDRKERELQAMLKLSAESIRFQEQVELAARYNREQARKEEHQRWRAQQTFPDRVDKTILWPVYSKQYKLFSKYSLQKFKLDKSMVSPFVNQLDLKNDLVQQRQAFLQKMAQMDKESDYFNMIFKEIDEDDSDEMLMM